MQENDCVTTTGPYFLSGFSVVSAINSIAVRLHQIENFFGSSSSASMAFHGLNLIAFFPELAYNLKRNREISHSLDNISESSNKVLPRFAATLGGIGTGVGHGFIFYAGHQECYEKYGHASIKIPPAVFIALAALGGIQEFIHGGLELAEGASREPSVSLFYSSDEVANSLKSCMKSYLSNFLINSFLCAAAAGEFALFYEEINHLFPNGYQYGLEFLSVVSASMYLVHEGHMLLELVRSPSDLFLGLKKELCSKKTGASAFLLLSIINALVTGLSRYEAIAYLFPGSPVPLRLYAGTASGISRLATFCMPLTHPSMNHVPQNTECCSLQYTALQQGKDIMYEACFILLMLTLPADATFNTTLGWGVTAGIGSEILSFLLDGFNSMNKNEDKNHDPKDYENCKALVTHILMDGIIAPILSMSFFCYLTEHYQTLDDFHKATATVMASLVIKHALKKWFDCWPIDASNLDSHAKVDQNSQPEPKEADENQSLLSSRQVPQPYSSSLAEEGKEPIQENNNDKPPRKNFCEQISGVISSFTQGFFYYTGNPKKTASLKSERLSYSTNSPTVQQ